MMKAKQQRRRGRGEGTITEINRKRSDGSVYTIWCGRASLGFDGKGQHVRKAFYGKSKSDVLDDMAKWRLEHRTGTFADDKNLTVGQYLEKWLTDSVQTSLRDKTAVLYRDMVRLHLTPALGGHKVSKLSPLHIQQALGGIGRKIKGNGRTPQLCYSILRAALNQAIQWRLLSINPCSGVSKPKSTPRKMRVWDEQQVKKFLKGAKDDPLFPLFSLALATGMRRGELLGLHWDDFKEGTGVIEVQRQLVEINGSMELGEVKTASGKRGIDLPAETVKMLRKCRKGADGPLVFHRDGEMLTGTLVSRSFKAAAKAAQVPEIGFHEMRHTHATLLLSKGVSPKVVQERLGHSNVTITLQTYSHVLPRLQAGAAAALNGVFK